MSSGTVQSLRNTLVQKGKIDWVEEKTARRPQPERISNVTCRSEFSEASQTGFSKALMRHELTHPPREDKLAHVALIMVRREALRRVLEEERKIYTKELSQRGLAIYQQRM